MKVSAPACAVIAILLSACVSSGPSAVESYRLTKADITAGGGRCSGNLCTTGSGQVWDCSGGGACFRTDVR